LYVARSGEVEGGGEVKKISNEALTVLRNSEACSVDNAVRLPAGQLDRSIYTAVNDVLTRLGGKWNTRAKAHLFPHDPAPLLFEVQESGVMPDKNPNAFFPTPTDIVERMCEWITFKAAVPRLLEPSAGDGAIAKQVRHLMNTTAGRDYVLDCCEIDAARAAWLEADGFSVVAPDFLNYSPPCPYDVVLMNPPFAVAGDSLAYITHIERAWGFVGRGGVLAAIAPIGFTFRTDRRSTSFLALVQEHGHFEALPANAFKESGTGVATALVVLTR
jgi:hypothetical protein